MTADLLVPSEKAQGLDTKGRSSRERIRLWSKSLNRRLGRTEASGQVHYDCLVGVTAATGGISQSVGGLLSFLLAGGEQV